MLILKSKYFFSLSKIFDIKNLKKKVSNENYLNEKNKKIFDKIFLFYNKFIENSSDNSLLIMNEYIFKSLTNAPIFYGKKNFDLFLKCLKYIEKYEKIISFSSHYIKNLYEYLNELFHFKYNEINYCLYVFLQCLDSLILNTKSYYIEKTVFKTQFYIKKIDMKFKIHENFGKYVDKNKYLFVYGKISENNSENDAENDVENNSNYHKENNKENNSNYNNENDSNSENNINIENTSNYENISINESNNNENINNEINESYNNENINN
jgi:hypothetical protein